MQCDDILTPTPKQRAEMEATKWLFVFSVERARERVQIAVTLPGRRLFHDGVKAHIAYTTSQCSQRTFNPIPVFCDMSLL